MGLPASQPAIRTTAEHAKGRHQSSQRAQVPARPSGAKERGVQLCRTEPPIGGNVPQKQGYCVGVSFLCVADVLERASHQVAFRRVPASHLQNHFRFGGSRYVLR